MKILKINELSFYKITWYFGRHQEFVRFDGSLVDHSNATFKWIEYEKD